MEHDKKYTIKMHGGQEKEPERSPPPPQREPERRKDIPAYEPEPLTESPTPGQIEPDEGWDRE